MRRVVYIIFILVVAYFRFATNNHSSRDSRMPAAVTTASTGDDALARAFANHQSNVEVHAFGTVKKLLPDDTEGLKHQRFIINTPSGQSILIAHSIDQAPRIDALKPGDIIEFTGEYEWSPQGGVVHWTHHDSSGRHPQGWIKLNGQVYQ